MAAFCKQCSIAMFAEDHRELAEITTETDYEKGVAAVVICEGCGPIQVDPEGVCISEDCDEKHGNKK